MYFLIVHIDFSSADSTNCFQVLYFAFLTFLLYSFHFFFHCSQSTLLFVLVCRFLAWFSSFLDFMRSSFHHLLLNGDCFFRGVVLAIALQIAFVISVANLSMASSAERVSGVGIGGRLSCSLVSSTFQFVLEKLYGGCMGVVSRGVRSRMVSIGR